MVTMENAEEVMQILDRFTRLKQKEIPKELDEYLGYVAKTGDTIFNWTSLKYLFREKLLNVIKTFHDTTPRVDEIPQYPNVDPFNYESMKSSLLERLELFNAAPFTIQRLCELLIDPRKQYSRIDKFMRALEKNILVSTVEPGRKRTESENGDSLDSVVNGDISLDVNVDIDMEADGLFHNSEKTNGNGIASKAEVEAAKDEVKLEEKAATKTTHANDDDNLPNPKKAKLDLPEEEDDQQVISKENEESVENLTVEKEQIVEESKAAKDGEVQKEKAEKMVCEEKRENKEDIDCKVEANVEKDKDVLKVEIKVEDEKIHEEMEEKKESDDKEISSIAATGDDKVEAKEEKKVEENKETKQVQELEKDGYLNKKEDKSAKIEEKIEIDGKVKSDNKSDKEGIHQEEAQVENSTEIVVEKQELEITEKVEIVGKKCIETKINIENQDKSENGNLRKSDKETKEEVADKDEDKQVKKPDIPQEKSEDTKVNTESNSKEVKEEKEAEGNVIESTKAKKQSESEVEPTKTEEKILNEHTNVEHEIKEETITETDQQQIEGKVSKGEEETAILTRAEIEVKETEKEIITPITQVERNSPKKELSSGEEKQADTKKESEITSASTETSPILTLNDETMAEDKSIEESTPTIEEVVMSEPPSNIAANSAKDVQNPINATAMSTDEAASTNSKIEEEPSGMEVDDTSQEAMDQ